MKIASFLRRALAATAFVFTTGMLSAEVSTWTNLDGQAMQAEFLSRKGDYVSFRKDDGSRYLYPYAKLSEADRIRVDALAAPAKEPAAIEEAAGSASPAPQTTSAETAASDKLAAALGGKLVMLKGGSLVPAPRDRLDGARFVAVYYSAHWCPPCRAFTPELVEFYNNAKSRRPELEVIFVSSDRDRDAMKGYMKEYKMPWPALDFDKKDSTPALRRPDHERGIPNLVFMNADGKELSVSYTPDGEYRGPRAVLADMKKQLKL
jgi:nucleoredoxin